jgi:glycerate 2-kinase
MFSTIKGGRLALAAHPAPIMSLIISDVPGDDPAFVASGPTIASNDGVEQARAIVEKYALDLPEAARRILDENSNPPPRPGDKRLTGARHEIIASAALSLDAAAKAARQAGCEVVVLSDAIEGEAREVGAEHAALILEKKKTKSEKPLLILSGGETSVTIGAGAQKPGKGGRNSEYLLALALGISGLDDVHALAADTDGRDGSEDNAGAFADGSSVTRMARTGVNAVAYLENHDAWTAFNSVDDLLVTGPTRTNVNDFRAALLL